jgi:hypothetical protein
MEIGRTAPAASVAFREEATAVRDQGNLIDIELKVLAKINPDYSDFPAIIFR